MILDLSGRRYVVRQSSSPRTRALAAYAGKVRVASLWWTAKTGECHVYVHPLHRRRGLASALFWQARDLEPRLYVSALRTDIGEAWARSLGVPLRRRLRVETELPL